MSSPVSYPVRVPGCPVKEAGNSMPKFALPHLFNLSLLGEENG